MPIPRIIHQTWKTDEVPDRLKKFQRTWMDFHGSWEYKLWTDEEIDQFVRTEYPWFADYWDSYPHHIQRVDAFRYFVMHKYGGVYADLDMQCLTSFEPLVKSMSGVVLGQEGQMHKDGMMRVGNAILISEPGHEFWNHVFEALGRMHGKSTEKISSVFATTGPTFLHEVYRAHPHGVSVMPSSAFYPIPWSMPPETTSLVSRKQYPKSWAAHHWEGVWRGAPRMKQVEHGGVTYKFAIPKKKSEGFGIVERTVSSGAMWRGRLLETLQGMLEPGDAVVVVGAYTGTIAIPLAKFVGSEGLVYCFEADARARNTLEENARLNGVSGTIQTDARVVCAQANARAYRVSKENPLKPHRVIWRVNQPNAIEAAPATALDALGFDEVALVHVDANGEEYGALQGAAQLLQTARPVLSVEIWADDKRTMFGTQIAQRQTFSLLEQLGYSYAKVDGDVYLCMPRS